MLGRRQAFQSLAIVALASCQSSTPSKSDGSAEQTSQRSQPSQPVAPTSAPESSFSARDKVQGPRLMAVQEWTRAFPKISASNLRMLMSAAIVATTPSERQRLSSSASGSEPVDPALRTMLAWSRAYPEMSAVTIARFMTAAGHLAASAPGRSEATKSSLEIMREWSNAYPNLGSRALAEIMESAAGQSSTRD